MSYCKGRRRGDFFNNGPNKEKERERERETHCQSICRTLCYWIFLLLDQQHWSLFLYFSFLPGPFFWGWNCTWKQLQLPITWLLSTRVYHNCVFRRTLSASVRETGFVDATSQWLLKQQRQPERMRERGRGEDRREAHTERKKEREREREETGLSSVTMTAVFGSFLSNIEHVTRRKATFTEARSVSVNKD